MPTLAQSQQCCVLAGPNQEATPLLSPSSSDAPTSGLTSSSAAGFDPLSPFPMPQDAPMPPPVRAQCAHAPMPASAPLDPYRPVEPPHAMHAPRWRAFAAEEDGAPDAAPQPWSVAQYRCAAFHVHSQTARLSAPRAPPLPNPLPHMSTNPPLDHLAPDYCAPDYCAPAFTRVPPPTPLDHLAPDYCASAFTPLLSPLPPYGAPYMGMAAPYGAPHFPPQISGMPPYPDSTYRYSNHLRSQPPGESPYCWNNAGCAGTPPPGSVVLDPVTVRSQPGSQAGGGEEHAATFSCCRMQPPASVHAWDGVSQEGGSGGDEDGDEDTAEVAWPLPMAVDAIGREIDTLLDEATGYGSGLSMRVSAAVVCIFFFCCAHVRCSGDTGVSHMHCVCVPGRACHSAQRIDPCKYEHTMMQCVCLWHLHAFLPCLLLCV